MVGFFYQSLTSLVMATLDSYGHVLVGKYVLKPATVGPVGGLLQSRIRPPWTLAQGSDDGTKSIQHHEGN
jgi:hypothetical protein